MLYSPLHISSHGPVDIFAFGLLVLLQAYRRGLPALRPRCPLPGLLVPVEVGSAPSLVPRVFGHRGTRALKGANPAFPYHSPSEFSSWISSSTTSTPQASALALLHSLVLLAALPDAGSLAASWSPSRAASGGVSRAWAKSPRAESSRRKVRARLAPPSAVWRG